MWHKRKDTRKSWKIVRRRHIVPRHIMDGQVNEGGFLKRKHIAVSLSDVP